MSRIYEALKSAQESRTKNVPIGSDSLGIMELADRRESPRQDLDSDLTVYGRAFDDAPFYEQAKAVRSETAKGGLFLLPVPVAEGQELLLINNRTSQEQICRVVNFMVRDAQIGEVSDGFSSVESRILAACADESKVMKSCGSGVGLLDLRFEILRFRDFRL